MLMDWNKDSEARFFRMFLRLIFCAPPARFTSRYFEIRSNTAFEGTSTVLSGVVFYGQGIIETKRHMNGVYYSPSLLEECCSSLSHY